jgi:hypothetical protein
MKPIIAGLVAAIPVAVFFALYVTVRGKALIAVLQEQEESIAKMTEKTLRILTYIVFIDAALLFGVLSGVVYGWLGMPTFRYVALCAATLLSLLALVSKTPLVLDKVIWNVAVGVGFGILVPLLVG